MATMTNEQIEQKKQLLAEKVKEIKAIYDELVEAGVWPLNENDLDEAAGSKGIPPIIGNILEQYTKNFF